MGNRVVGVWGSNSIVMNVAVLPLPHHADYLREPNRWV